MEPTINQSVSMALALKQINTQAEFQTAVFKEAVQSASDEIEALTELMDVDAAGQIIDLLV